MNAEAVRQLIPFILLPGEPVKVGGRWHERLEYTEPLLGLRQADVTYQLTGQETKAGLPLVKFTSESDLRFTAPRQGTKAQARDSESRGTVFFDRAAGRLIEKNEAEKLKVIIHESAGPIDQSIQSNVSVRLNTEKGAISK
jgi:hypothetical protein